MRHLNAPRADSPQVKALARRLAEVGFSEHGIRDACGSGASSDPWALAASQPFADGSPFATCVALFWSGAPVPAAQVESALAPLRLTDLERMCLVESHDDLVHPRCLIRPAGDLLIVSDLPIADADCVLGNVPASETLTRLTVRRPAGRGLDLGTGCGIQGLLLARHSETVDATDVNPRALAFARFNAELNGIGNVRCLEGSWFEPVEGARFDTIACNPPYVISPESTYTYRDGGLPRDAVSRMVIGEAGRHLAAGGFATVLCNWVYDDAWADPLRSWVADTGCDALLLHYSTVGPADYAARWNMELGARAPEAYRATVKRWTDYFDAEGITHIGLGAVILRRRQDGMPWVRCLEMATGPGCQSSDHILRLFDAADFLASERGRDLFRQAYRMADGHRVDQTLNFSDGAYSVRPAVFRCVPGMGLEARVDARALEVLLECNGERSLDDLVREAAQRRGEPVDDVKKLVEAAGRQLVERGFMIPIVDDKTQ
jgi:methylase of polypeptide subunit release factors